MTYEAAIQLIKQKQSLGVQPGLSHMLAAMEKTGSVQNKLQVIHVAGTNGKGTFALPWPMDCAVPGPGGRIQLPLGHGLSRADHRGRPDDFKQDFADCVEVFANNR